LTEPRGVVGIELVGVLPSPGHRSIVLKGWSLHQTRGASAVFAGTAWFAVGRLGKSEQQGRTTPPQVRNQKTPSEEGVLVERTTRFELATLTLAR
jgi:hypothetical protein